MEDKPVYYTIKEAAEIINVHENTIRNWIESGTLQAIHIGDIWRIPKESLPKVKPTEV